MPLNPPHNLNAVHLSGYSPSVGATPVVVYVGAPFKGEIRKVTCILGGALTTADCTMTVANVTSGAAIGTFTVTQSGSAAGSFFSFVPTSYTNSLVTEDDVISCIPSGASGASIPAHFKFAFRTF